MVCCNCTGMAESLFSSHKEDYPDVEHASLCQLFQHKVGWSLGRCNLFSLNECDWSWSLNECESQPPLCTNWTSYTSQVSLGYTCMYRDTIRSMESELYILLNTLHLSAYKA